MLWHQEFIRQLLFCMFSFYQCLEIFYKIQVRTVSRPLQHTDSLLTQKTLQHLGAVTWTTIVLEHSKLLLWTSICKYNFSRWRPTYRKPFTVILTGKK